MLAITISEEILDAVIQLLRISWHYAPADVLLYHDITEVLSGSKEV